MTAACYIRVSTEDQTEYSPDAQLAAIRRYAADNDLTLDPVHIYRDEGISGRSAARRPGFQAMIAAAKRPEHPFDVILVHRLDRFARSREDSVVYKSMLQRECRVRVISVTEPLTDDKTAILMEPILEAMAEYYSVNLSEEVKKGMTQKALTGGLQAAPPFGYLVRDNRLIPDPDTAPVAVMLFERFAAGDGLYTLARRVNAMGVRTRRGAGFESRTVEYILRNPAYIGKLRWNPKHRTRRRFDDPDLIITAGQHEPLIPQALFDAAQQRLDALKASHPYRGKPVDVSRKHWLCGLLRCAACGATLLAHRWQSGLYFHCGGHSRGRCLYTQQAPAALLEQAVLAQLSIDLSCTAVPQILSRPRHTSDCGAESESLHRAVAALERRRERLRDAYLGGVDTLEEYRSGRAAIDAQLAELRQRLESTDKPSPADDGLLREALNDVLYVLRSDAISTERRHAAAQNVLESVLFDRERNLLTLCYHAHMTG